jgi:SAM-dependent methyltransferase
MPAAPGPVANSAMQQYWNEVAGPRWVGRQATQEARNVEMLAQLLAAAKAAPGERVLDIGCGTGVTTEPYAVAVGPTGHVTGVDISRPMLDAAEERIATAGLKNVSLLLADAQVHPFEPAAYDLLTSRLGVMFFADPVAAFTNLIGALKPGGRLVMAVWATIADNTHWKIPYEIAIRHVGPPAPASSREPGPFAYSDRGYLREILTAAGYAEIAIEARHFQVVGATPEAMAEHSVMFGAVQRLLDEKNASAETRQSIVDETKAQFATYASDEGVRLPGTFLLVSARRPG